MDQATTSLLRADFSSQLCFELGNFSAFFLSPVQFRSVAALVGAVRARSYRQVSAHGPEEIDLDGRDDHYWHLLVLDQQRGTIAGTQRLALSQWHEQQPWDGSRSYLEHCYPGLDQAFCQRGEAYAEIGRTCVASPYQRTSPVLLMLLRAMVSIPLATGHSHLLGMVSYNHFHHSAALQRSFLSRILQPPFLADLAIPPPRHPFPALSPTQVSRSDSQPDSLSQLERSLERQFQEPFRVPILLKKYVAFGNAHVAGVSLARDFNQICEIFLHCDLNRLFPHQRRMLLVEDLRPVWQDALS
ncbi:MAG: GNAT family N-acetyltransferase [Cyanobacteriota bacterium]